MAAANDRGQADAQPRAQAQAHAANAPVPVGPLAQGPLGPAAPAPVAPVVPPVSTKAIIDQYALSPLFVTPVVDNAGNATGMYTCKACQKTLNKRSMAEHVPNLHVGKQCMMCAFGDPAGGDVREHLLSDHPAVKQGKKWSCTWQGCTKVGNDGLEGEPEAQRHGRDEDEDRDDVGDDVGDYNDDDVNDYDDDDVSRDWELCPSPIILIPVTFASWPAGNSGVVTYFLPENNVDGTLGISLEVIVDFNRTLNPLISGVTGLISLNSSAVLDLAIVGSIRTIRNYVEGGSLDTKIQDAIQTQQLADGGIQLNRIWLDETTETFLTFQSTTGVAISIQHGQAHFEAGTYSLNAWFTYPQLDQLCATDVLSPTSQDLLSQNPEDTQSLSFFSFKSKIVAGGWKFLTYFGRDSLITLLLLQPVLSEGQGGAIETIISAAVERIDLNDGSVCHEETIGDYATYLNEQQGIHSTDAQCDYKMVDTDFFLPIVMDQYFVQSDVGKSRRDVLLATNASVIRSNQGSTYIDLVLATAEKIMGLTAALEKSATKENLIQLKQGQAVGQWRDSESGLGGGRIPYDVNTALVPAALKAIASLSSNGLFPSHPKWSQTAADRAVFWEDNTLAMFEVHIPADEARSLIENYVNASSFSGPTDTGEATSPVLFHGLALDGKNQQPIVKVMNTDDCFRLFLLDPKNQIQLTAYISQVADNILHPFPIGLSTSVGLLVANPAYAGTSADIDDFSSISYHGTVVWSWQMAMMAAGLERQLGRCNNEQLEFCANEVKQKAIKAYNHLWDLIESNREYLSSEVWSWVMEEGDFQYASLGALPRPDGQGSIESDIRQLWSLTFLAVKRNDAYGLERAAQ
ncbi:Uu.00g141850.m01.CDS01 [Anthostomella pinea]|uniref:Uu.00g141850.m01.CDS01 n=1 Tax=Anthostomella pinea TaxID=933095 RepID=A0AAI8VR09_9PEZI|nr:Uu.00g141850.m01.CDS01 [Anthostomella pinea]